MELLSAISAYFRGSMYPLDSSVSSVSNSSSETTKLYKDVFSGDITLLGSYRETESGSSRLVSSSGALAFRQ